MSEQKAREFWNTLPHCCGYPNCDGDLVAMAHSAQCPLFEKEELTTPEFAAAFSAHQTAALQKQLQGYKSTLELEQSDHAKLLAIAEKQTAAKDEEIARLTRSAQAWEDTAAQHCRNEMFYRGLVVQIGEPFGKPAYTSDDGSVQQDVLALRVPELVENLRAQLLSVERKTVERVVGVLQSHHGRYYDLTNVIREVRALAPAEGKPYSEGQPYCGVMWKEVAPAEGKEAKRPRGRTYPLSDGRLGCDECCNGDRCDDRSHVSREGCKYCGGTGIVLATPEPEAGAKR